MPRKSRHRVGGDGRLLRNLSLREAGAYIRDADLLLFRDCIGVGSYLIRVAGGSRYSHAAMAVRIDSTLCCAEVREWHGGRIVSLASQVRKYSGKIDVFEANPDGRCANFDSAGARRFMLDLAGCEYGWGHIAAAALWHLPFVRLFAGRPSEDDLSESKLPPFCSEAVAAAYRLGGDVDPVPLRADKVTEPGQLATSMFFRYRFTLTV